MRISDWSSDVCSSDLTIQAMTGVMHTTGYADRPPVKAGPAIADFFAGIHLYGALATALFERERTGVVRRLEEIGRASSRERVCQLRLDLGGRRLIKNNKIPGPS